MAGAPALWYPPPLTWPSRGTHCRVAGTVEDVTDENYEVFKNAHAAVIVYGIASCEPCAAYDAVLARVAPKAPHVRIGKAKMHVPGRCREIKKQHQFETYPTTHFYARGRLLMIREGCVEEDELTTLIQRHFPNGVSQPPADPATTAASLKAV